MSKPNVNAYWETVQKKYPEAQFDFWYSSGELLFHPTLLAKEHDMLMSCIKGKDEKFYFIDHF